MAAGRKTPKQLQLDGLPTIHPNAAGMDIGAELIVVAVPADRDPEPVRAFRTFTPDLQELVSWLLACGVDTIAMESTGIYWVAILKGFHQAKGGEQDGILWYDHACQALISQRRRHAHLQFV